MKYDVTAVCLDVETGQVIAGPRTEQIDVEENVIFSSCRDAADVEDKYEGYWNRLNGFTNHLPHGKVKVLTVEAA